MTANLRALVATGRTIPAPGATDALSARLIEAHGYECVYIGSYATAASRFGITDTGRLSLEQLVAHAKTIADAVRIPVIADAEAFENAVPAFEKAGVAAIHIEDHTGAAIVFSAATQFAALQKALADGRLAIDARPLEDFLGYKDAPGRSRQ